jgi:hypothetical protein
MTTNHKLRFRRSRLKTVARRYAYAGSEAVLLEARPQVRQRGYLTKKQLQTIADWKSPRSAGHIAGNDEAFVREITRFALSAKAERVRIETLTLLNGVSWPTASVILHFFHRQRYPILDFRALWSVSLDVPNQFTFPFWLEYVEFCRKLATKCRVNMRTLDRALWQYSKEYQAT